MKHKSLTIAIPTYNNPQQLCEALVSLTRNTDFDGRILVINNGNTKYEDIQGAVPYEVDWINAPENLGWQNGINLALANDSSEIFVMSNDDVMFPVNRFFWQTIQGWFSEGNEGVGGVGPMSNYVSGYQNFHLHGMPDTFRAGVLIGFFAAYRRSVLGDGLDASLPGGDDYDLSIRVQKQGYSLIVDRRMYVHHFGSQTGQRVHPGYWDSQEHQEKTYNAIIKKHSFNDYWYCMNRRVEEIGGVMTVRTDISLDDLYHGVKTVPSDIYEHVETLCTFAKTCDSVTEFGVDDGTTTIAFLQAKPKKLTSYDIVRKPEVDMLMKHANGTQFKFIQKSTLEVEIDPTDMLWIDDWHTYKQVKQELNLHANKVKKYIFFHDTNTLAYDGEEGIGTGILPAITEFLKVHPEWRIINLQPNNNGLMGIARVA